MKNKNFDKAIEVFKSFEKKDRIMMARASTNISFLYFIEKDWKNAEKYADVAIKNDRYNAKALVNKGNCLFMREDFEKSKEYFLEAIGVEADCVEAIYNLGLVNRHIG
jgi:intraflagellar transport protein 88